MTVQLGSKSVRVLDVHSHLGPTEWKVPTAPAAMFDVEGQLRRMDEGGMDCAFFGNNWIRTPEGMPALEVVKRYNEFAAEVTAKHPGRLYGLASAVPYESDEFLLEAERAIRELGLKGFQINTSTNGEYFDSVRAYPFFELLQSLDVPAFIHPPKFTIGNEKMEIFRLPEMVGRPFDTTLTLARFILTGGFERFPHLKLIAAHMGGAITLLPGRLDMGYEMRHDPAFGPWEPDVLTAPPSTYINMLYVDTMGFHAPGVMCCVGTLGAAHVMLGSDCPPIAFPLSRTIDVVCNLPISLDDREAILGGNAARLFGI
ncbi:MAG: aminocarboxymuconate-semialdehyde decarboxylase [Chloroflexota bacterium]|jgi:aminocarboxymuconate-semialdehyde decarboxylase|nr:aminocarboxymuconate-semialdehyde decarboxylase [Chloroflexota bacterium]